MVVLCSCDVSTCGVALLYRSLASRIVETMAMLQLEQSSLSIQVSIFVFVLVGVFYTITLLEFRLRAMLVEPPCRRDTVPRFQRCCNNFQPAVRRMRIGPVTSSGPTFPTLLPFCKISRSPDSRICHAMSRIADMASRQLAKPSSVNSSAEHALATSDGQNVLGGSLLRRKSVRCRFRMACSPSDPSSGMFPLQSHQGDS